MFLLMRTVIYGSLFVGVLLVYVPARFLSIAGIARPATTKAPQMIGMAIAAGGMALALWTCLAFVVVGKGTPAPFDPPRRLVVSGPYRFVRNPMYLGAGLGLGGAALVYGSWQIVAYLCLLFAASHGFIVFYEEPTLRRRFGEEYDAYCRMVRRWIPRYR